MTLRDIFASDIALDKNGQAIVLETGELQLTEGVETPLQDIKLRLFTRLGGLFYDCEFGSLLPDFVKDELTPQNELAIKTEIMRTLEFDSRIEQGSIQCRVINDQDFALSLYVLWQFTGEMEMSSLNLNFAKNGEMNIE